MRSLFQGIDRLLRGQFTRRESLLLGRIEAPARSLALAGLLLGASYGAFMGLYGALRPLHASAWQVVASAVKVPLLFLLTLVVAFPSLYVFSALSNSRLSCADTLRLLLAAITVNVALLASFGPVTAFFTLSTDSYTFMVVLDVLFFTVSGCVGLGFLRRALHHVFDARSEVPNPQPAVPAAPELPPAPAGATDFAGLPVVPALPRRRPQQPARAVFTIWILIYAVVGAQMGWILRPFIGTPERPFSWFRERESNFFEAVLHALRNLFA